MHSKVRPDPKESRVSSTKRPQQKPGGAGTAQPWHEQHYHLIIGLKGSGFRGLGLGFRVDGSIGTMVRGFGGLSSGFRGL